MRVLHILDHSLPLQSGYTFRTRAIMKAQLARGWTVEAVTGVRQGQGAGTETVDGLIFHRTPPIVPSFSPLTEWREICALSARLHQLAEQFRPDILHAHSPVLGALAALRVARRRSLPLLYEIRAFWEDAATANRTLRAGSPRYRAIRAIERHAVHRADGIAVICNGLRDDLIARGVPPAKIMVSPNGVDLDLFGTPVPRDEALAARLGLAGAQVVGFIGSFYDYEGLDDLIAGMPALVGMRPTAQLLLVGGGPMEVALRAQAAVSPVSTHIVFAGSVPHELVERYYSLIDVLAYPRKSSRLTELVTPLKPLEAMAQGRIVAASDVGGHRELIEDGVTGTLFAPDSPAAIAFALAALFATQDNWPIQREAARAFVERDRNWSLNIARYEPVYRRLIAARKDGKQPW